MTAVTIVSPRLRRALLAATLLVGLLLAAFLVDDASAAAPTATPAARATTPTPTPAAPATPTPTPKPAPQPPIKASEVLKGAEQYLRVPYVFGGFSPTGLDCSGYVSMVWRIPRRTTDTI